MRTTINMLSVKAILSKLVSAVSNLQPVRSTVSPSAVSVPDSTPTVLASITLSAGTYILQGTCRYDASGSGDRMIFFNSSDSATGGQNRYANMRCAAAPEGHTCMQLPWNVTVTTTTTVYLYGYQSCGGALTAYYPGIQAIRLG